MTFQDWIHLCFATGVALFLLGGFVLIGAGGSLGRSNNLLGNVLTLLFDKELRKVLLEDMHNPKIVAGGILGLVIKMYKLGGMLILLGGILWGVSYL